MSDMMSKIYADENEWASFCQQHGLKFSDDPYSFEARAAYEAANKGLTGEEIMSYVLASEKAETLRKQANDLMKPFDELVKIKKLIKTV